MRRSAQPLRLSGENFLSIFRQHKFKTLLNFGASMNAEEKRLKESTERKKHWKRWGPYLSERAWGTVREDYSANGSAWDYFPHEHARSRTYRWNEDGIAGISDRHQRICFALSFWNGRDPILKERMFGLTGKRRQSRRRCQGNLLLSRQHADAFVYEISLQISAERISLREIDRGKPQSKQTDWANLN